MTTENNASPLIVIVRPRARADQIENAKRALEKIAAPTRSNPDCLEFRIFQDRDDPQSFTLVEQWVSLDAVMEHGKRDYMAEYMASKDTLFEIPPTGEFVIELSNASGSPMHVGSSGKFRGAHCCL